MPGAAGSEAASSDAMSCVRPNSVCCVTSTAFRAFSAACCAWKQGAPNKGPVWRAMRSATARSSSAFASHCRASARRTSSGFLVEDHPFLPCRIGEPADHCLALFELILADDPRLGCDAVAAEEVVESMAILAPLGGGQGTNDDKQVVIAVRPGVPTRPRAEEHYTTDTLAVSGDDATCKAARDFEVCAVAALGLSAEAADALDVARCRACRNENEIVLEPIGVQAFDAPKRHGLAPFRRDRFLAARVARHVFLSRGCDVGRLDFDHEDSPASRHSTRARPLSNDRSEEHTSELQSLAYLVCRLLLEKKKIIMTHKPKAH